MFYNQLWKIRLKVEAHKKLLSNYGILIKLCFLTTLGCLLLKYDTLKLSVVLPNLLTKVVKSLQFWFLLPSCLWRKRFFKLHLFRHGSLKHLTLDEIKHFLVGIRKITLRRSDVKIYVFSYQIYNDYRNKKFF